MPTPVPSEEQQSLAKPLYERPAWHYMFSISAFAVGQILPIIWFLPAQLATIITLPFHLYLLTTLVLYLILVWLSSPYKRDLRAIVAGTGIFLVGFYLQANRQVHLFQEAQTALAFAATQTARPTFTSTPTSTLSPTSTLTPRPTPSPTTPAPTITHTPTATLLPMFLTATEIASIATQAMIVETEYALALTATVEALVATVTYRLSFEDIDFRELRDYPDNHIGEKVCVEGFISEVYSPTDFQMLVGDLADAVYVVTATEFSKIYRGDQVRICGVSDGYSLLKNLLRGQESTPLVKDAFFP